MTVEQKAEEIANKRCKEIGCFGHCNFSSPKHHRCGEWHREYKCALDGYHECQKEHEWHYVKDGDLPKDMKNVLINAFDYGINTCYVAHRINGKWKSNCSSETFVHVIKWKEIE